MPHISKIKLEQEILDKLFSKMVNILERAQTKKRFSAVVRELLTETEKVMLAKRLAIILMLEGGVPQHHISDVLHVSSSTVVRISLGLELGKYDAIRSISKTKKMDLEKVVWLLLTAGGIMPPRAGGKYWRRKDYT